MRTLTFSGIAAWVAIGCGGPGTAQAHEVRHRIEAGDAVVVTLVYGNGRPFAHKPYTLAPAGQTKPQQSGNTDAAGRVVFIPGDVAQWRLRAASANGHGVALEFAAPAPAAVAMPAPPAAPALSAAPAPAAVAAAPAAAPTEVLPRWGLGLIGVSSIFGLFGLYQLRTRNKT